MLLGLVELLITTLLVPAVAMIYSIQGRVSKLEEFSRQQIKISDRILGALLDDRHHGR